MPESLRWERQWESRNDDRKLSATIVMQSSGTMDIIVSNSKSKKVATMAILAIALEGAPMGVWRERRTGGNCRI